VSPAAQGGARRDLGRSLPEMRVAPPGPRSREAGARLAALESPSVDARRESRERQSGEPHAPIVYAEGKGCNVVDVDGNVYVDLAAGFGALLLGHRPDAVAAALASQTDRLWLALGDVYGSDAKLALCERLAAMYPAPGARVMLGATGADAVTAALKTALLATGRPGVIAFDGAYHGLSYAPLAACGLRPSFREPFAGQLGDHVLFAPYPDGPAALGASMTAVEDALEDGDVGAILVEPILGRGGCVVPPLAFLAQLRAACDRHGALLVCDEIWTGLGRSGAWPFASVAQGVVPDVVCLGKGLGAGLPISACVGRGEAMAAWGRHGGSTIHTATHFGAPLACAAAVAALGALEAAGLPERANQVGEAWMQLLSESVREHGGRVRGRGLMVGIALEGGAPRALAAMKRLLARGWIVLTGGPSGDVLTLTPPLDVEPSILGVFAEVLASVLAELPARGASSP
jgi:4-aminobutyrate aminotransferase/(S)-3-amino-2-methylpropionate transaminase